MNLNRFSLLFITILISGIIACSGGHEYKRMVEKELAKGERHDSIFLGFHFDMTKQDFFDRCWNLNRQGLVRQGAENATVNFNMDLLGQKLDVDFYPNFYQDKIYEMEVSYKYFSWSPWQKEKWAEVLMYKILAIYEKTYGDGFIEIKNPHPYMNKDKVAFVKVDGNRRISIYEKDERIVKVLFTNLLVEEAAEQANAKLANNKDEKLPIWFEAQK